MQLSPLGAAFISGHEGFVGHWYNDPVGIPTIGIGFTKRSDSFQAWWKKNKRGVQLGTGTMTRDESEHALRYLCQFEYGRAVKRFLNKKVPQHVFDGMVSPVYNLGADALKWKWAAACKAGDYEKAAGLLENTGVTASGIFLAGLARRRVEEAALIEKGIYTGVAREPTKPADAMADGMLRRGERGPAVKELIVQLQSLGLYDGHVDDIFGPGCESAVMEFQRSTTDLTVDGIAGPVTLKAIKNMMFPQATPVKKARKTEKATAAVVGAGFLGYLAFKWSEFTEWLCALLPFCQ